MTHSLDAMVVEWARKTLADARTGQFDLRDLGKAMTAKWDQDFPAAVLAYIARAALESAGVAELREENERLRHLENVVSVAELDVTVAHLRGLFDIPDNSASADRAALTNQGKAQG